MDTPYKPNWTEEDLASIYANGTATHIELTLALDDLLHARKELRAQLAQAREERDAAYEEIRLSRESEGRVYADLLATREELERVRRSAIRGMMRRASDEGWDGFFERCMRFACVVRREDPSRNQRLEPRIFRFMETRKKFLHSCRAALTTTTTPKEADRRALQGGKDGEA